MKTAIVGATLVDGTGALPIPDACVLVDGDTIVQVGACEVVEIPDDAQRIEARGKFLLPGLIDLHAHMFYPDMVQGSTGREAAAYAGLVAANNLRQALQAGITTLREVGDVDYLDMSLKRAVAEGVILGPRLFVAGRAICNTGGDVSNAEGFVQIADGADQVRQTVREQIRAGADVIKFMATPEFTQEELNAGVEEAHRRGRRVACHIASVLSGRMAVSAGTETVEHGVDLDDETLDAMVERNVVWVPTCAILNAVPAQIEAQLASPETDYNARKVLETRLSWYRTNLPLQANTFRRALERGVKIGTGTDSVMHDMPFALVPEEAEWLVRLGCTPMQAIEAATRVGAEALGMEKTLGTVEPVKQADLVLVERDPLADITALKHVVWVMKAGRVVPFAPVYDRMAGKAPWAETGIRGRTPGTRE